MDITQLSDQQRWELYREWLDHKEAAIRAHALLCLIQQTRFLLARQIAELEKSFIEGGGYSEQLATARPAERQKQKNPPGDSVSPSAIPPCPQCGKPMVLRTARSGKNTGAQFWGCSEYPDCKGTVKA